MACWTTTWTRAEDGGLWSDNDVCIGLGKSSERGSDSGLTMKTRVEEDPGSVDEVSGDVLMQRLKC